MNRFRLCFCAVRALVNRLCVILCAVGALAVPIGMASAGWNNVFQVALHEGSRSGTVFSLASHQHGAPVVSHAAAAASACQSCQQKNCTTKYQQRCQYQPVTTYQTQSYYEPVTTYQKSRYWEPVTSYRYSMFYDPASCCYRQVATPVTSYRVREQLCPVQSWVQRCASVPMTTYQKSCYWEKQTCCKETLGAPGTGTSSQASPVILPQTTPDGSGSQRVDSRFQPVPGSNLAAEERHTIEMYQRVKQSVVQIASFRNDRGTVRQISSGEAGFVWDEEGHIITNCHVVRNASWGFPDFFVVTLADKSKWTTSTVFCDTNRTSGELAPDLAVLKIDAPRASLNPIEIGPDSKNLETGQRAFVIGHPHGLSLSLTKGIISGLQRDRKDTSGLTRKGLIQIDAAIGHGNSGGPLLDSTGRLIGVISWWEMEHEAPNVPRQGLNFAVPVEQVKQFLAKLSLAQQESSAAPSLKVNPDAPPASPSIQPLPPTPPATIQLLPPAASPSEPQAPPSSSASPSRVIPPSTIPDPERKMPPATEEPPALAPPAKLPPAPNQPNPATKTNRIVLQSSASQVDGLIMHANSVPQSNARLVFVNASNQAEVRRTAADGAGQFHLAVSPGFWLVYVENSDGTRRFHSRVEVEQQVQPVRIILVSR